MVNDLYEVSPYISAILQKYFTCAQEKNERKRHTHESPYNGPYCTGESRESETYDKWMSLVRTCEPPQFRSHDIPGDLNLALIYGDISTIKVIKLPP